LNLPTHTKEPTEHETQRALVVINTKSRRGKEWAPRVRQALNQSSLQIEAFHETDRPDIVLEQVREACYRRVPLIIVGGGDGTLSSVMQTIVGTKSTLGVLPLGTGNAFAHDLGIPANPEGAAKILVEGKVAQVDLGVLHGKYFVNIATVGLTARIAEGLTDEMKRRYGRMAYGIAIFRAAVTAKPFEAILTTDKCTDEYSAMQFVVASGRYHGGFPVTPEAEITDGKLHGYILSATTKGALLKYALHLWGGRQVTLPEVHPFTTGAGRLETSRSLKVIVDGEPAERPPIDFKIAAGALSVMVPQSFERAKPAVSQG
jgi:diacylglycerol kinase (ATP)